LFYKKLFSGLAVGCILLITAFILQLPQSFFLGIVMILVACLSIVIRIFLDLGLKGRILMGTCLAALAGSLTVFTFNTINTARADRLAEKGLIWETHFYKKSSGDISDITLTPNSDIIFVGNASQYDETNMFYGKLDEDGRLIYKRNLPGFGSGSFASVVALSDGGAILAGAPYRESSFLLRIDPRGEVIWSKKSGSSKNVYINQIIPLDNDQFLVAGSDSGQRSDFPNAYISLLNIDGEIIWENWYGLDLRTSIHSISISVGKEIVAVGNYFDTNETNSLRFLKIGMDGEKISDLLPDNKKSNKLVYSSVTTSESEIDGRTIAGGQTGGYDLRKGQMAVYTVSADFQSVEVVEYTGPVSGNRGSKIYALRMKTDGNLIVAGHTYQKDNDGKASATIFEIGPDGTLADSWHMPAYTDTYIYDMIVLPSGAQIIAGQASADGHYKPTMFIAKREPKTGRSKAEIITRP